MVEESFPEVRLIANNENRGFATVNNQALTENISNVLKKWGVRIAQGFNGFQNNRDYIKKDQGDDENIESPAQGICFAMRIENLGDSAFDRIIHSLWLELMSNVF